MHMGVSSMALSVSDAEVEQVPGHPTPAMPRVLP
jgi:hypothetical protein